LVNIGVSMMTMKLLYVSGVVGSSRSPVGLSKKNRLTSYPISGKRSQSIRQLNKLSPELLPIRLPIEAAAIGVIEEYVLTGVATHDHMVQHRRAMDSRFSYHGKKLSHKFKYRKPDPMHSMHSSSIASLTPCIPHAFTLPGYGPVILSNRPVRTRMPGGVGTGGEKPPATRLGIPNFTGRQICSPSLGLYLPFLHLLNRVKVRQAMSIKDSVRLPAERTVNRLVRITWMTG